MKMLAKLNGTICSVLDCTVYQLVTGFVMSALKQVMHLHLMGRNTVFAREVLNLIHWLNAQILDVKLNFFTSAVFQKKTSVLTIGYVQLAFS